MKNAAWAALSLTPPGTTIKSKCTVGHNKSIFYVKDETFVFFGLKHPVHMCNNFTSTSLKASTSQMRHCFYLLQLIRPELIRQV